MYGLRWGEVLLDGRRLAQTVGLGGHHLPLRRRWSRHQEAIACRSICPDESLAWNTSREDSFRVYHHQNTASRKKKKKSLGEKVSFLPERY